MNVDHLIPTSAPAASPAVQEVMKTLFTNAEPDLYRIIGESATAAGLTREQVVELGLLLKNVAFRAFGLGLVHAAEACQGSSVTL